MLSLVADFQQNKPLVLNPKFVDGIRSILSDSSLDKVIIGIPIRSDLEFFSFLIVLVVKGLGWSMSALINLSLHFIIQEFIAKAVTLPGEGEIMDMMAVADPDAVHAVRTFIRKQLASELKAEFLSTVCHLMWSDFTYNKQIYNLCLSFNLVG